MSDGACKIKSAAERDLIDVHVSVTRSNILQGNGAWSVILMIDSVQKSDTEKEYMLMATNNEGSNEYRIILSTSPEPAGKLFDKSDLREFFSIESVTQCT